MADELNHYGAAVYGSDTYGDIPPVNPTIVIACLEQQPGYCPEYIRFQLSGVNLGLYIFELNPTEYDIYPQRRTQAYSHVNNFNGTIDSDYNKLEIELKWTNMPASMWEAISVYSRKKYDGTSEDLYFWDANFGRFCGRRIKLEEFRADVRGGYDPINRMNVSVLLREV